uniref:CVNH domain-containing protein n=1 Tax=Macrostomum lignano TaxID=282301 RepID=A0A1I8F9W8_9PLAT
AKLPLFSSAQGEFSQIQHKYSSGCTACVKWSFDSECKTCNTPLCNFQLAKKITQNNLLCYFADDEANIGKRGSDAGTCYHLEYKNKYNENRYHAGCGKGWTGCKTCKTSLCNIPDSQRALAEPSSGVDFAALFDYDYDGCGDFRPTAAAVAAMALLCLWLRLPGSTATDNNNSIPASSRQVRSGGIGDPHPAGVPDEGAEVSDIVRVWSARPSAGVAEVFVPRLVEVRQKVTNRYHAGCGKGWTGCKTCKTSLCNIPDSQRALAEPPAALDFAALSQGQAAAVGRVIGPRWQQSSTAEDTGQRHRGQRFEGREEERRQAKAANQFDYDYDGCGDFRPTAAAVAAMALLCLWLRLPGSTATDNNNS